MSELLKAIASWPSLLFVIVVFGFAPGFCLRLIVLAYLRGDPRRDELIAELYAVPRIHRPLWVAEQLEVALFEGLGQRMSAAIRRNRVLVAIGNPLIRIDRRIISRCCRKPVQQEWVDESQHNKELPPERFYIKKLTCPGCNKDVALSDVLARRKRWGG